MKKTLSLFVIIASLYLIACSPSRDKMLGNIEQMEKELKTAPKLDSTAINTLLAKYEGFSTKFPKDSLAPKYLMRAASLCVSFHRGEKAIELYDKVIKDYPENKQIAVCYFMKAFTYENVLNNIGEASGGYNRFLIMFPEHPLAKDAHAAIKYLGKTPEEVVHEFEKMNADSVAKASK